jgi:RsiW-degrading membrane proteinase PrsW (M82 family)
MASVLPRLLVGFAPVLLFLGALIYLDSYKLVRRRWILLTLALGGVVAGACYLVNAQLIGRFPFGPVAYSRYAAPWIEESVKALFLLYLIRTQRIGFLVDAAIYGFAIGTGFAVVENAYYLKALPDVSMTVWLIRGCGTAIMHGGATAIFGITCRALTERGIHAFVAGLPGIAIACVIHSVFNHFFLSPVLSALLMMLGLPPLLLAVFGRSERSLEGWLNVGFDADTELLELIDSGELSRSKVGLYLNSLKEKFRGEVVADMLCYLKLHVELSLRAKGLLMLRESGFNFEPDEETRAKFQELEYLEGSIGRTGKLAMAPFLHISDKELWQLHMIGK